MPIPIPSQDDAASDIVKVSPPSSDSSHSLSVMDEKPKIEHDEKKDEVDVQGMVDETVRRVREQSDRLQAAAMPYANRTRSFAEQRPVLFTFLAIFTALSIIPIACFTGFVLSATLFILGVAAVGICISVLMTLLFASSILLPILFFTSLISLTALSFLLTLFLVHRLYTHLTVTTTSASDYDGLSKGVKGWLDETTNRLPALPARWSDVGGQWRSDLTPRAKQESRFNARGMRNDGGGGVRAMEAHIRPDSGHGTAGIKS